MLPAPNEVNLYVHVHAVLQDGPVNQGGQNPAVIMTFLNEEGKAAEAHYVQYQEVKYGKYGPFVTRQAYVDLWDKYQLALEAATR